MRNFANFKKFFLFSLIGALIVSASVAVITILIGEFNDTTARVFLTLLMVVLHSLVSLLFIWDDERQNTFDRLAFFTNVLFSLIVVSFITSILGIWEVLAGKLVWKLYETYFLTGFAALHLDILSKALKKEGYIDNIIYANYFFIGIVYFMLLPTIFIDRAHVILGDFYYRLLAAMGIIDGTLSILAIIFYKLYIHKHPEVVNPLAPGMQEVKTQKKGLSVWVWILIIYLGFQVLTSLFFAASRSFLW